MINYCIHNGQKVLSSIIMLILLLGSVAVHTATVARAFGAGYGQGMSIGGYNSIGDEVFCGLGVG